jgi:hypothetical protein
MIRTSQHTYLLDEFREIADNRCCRNRRPLRVQCVYNLVSIPRRHLQFVASTKR